MNVSAVSTMSKRSDDFAALQSALQSGNLAGAQGAFAAFLQDAQTVAHQAGPGSLFSPGTQAHRDLDSLGGALKAADLAGARQAFSSLVQDLGGMTKPKTAAGHKAVTQAEVSRNGAGVYGSIADAGAVLNSRA